MKEWNHLLDIIDSFVYDKELEKIVFDKTDKSIKAKNSYDNLIKKYNLDEDENQKWAFDIALDCVRNMRDEDRDYLRESYDVDFFGYGMYVRNEYIHCAKNPLCSIHSSFPPHPKLLGTIDLLLSLWFGLLPICI